MRDDELFLVDGGLAPDSAQHYFTGRLPDGRMMLSLCAWIGEACGMLVLWFTADGCYSGYDFLAVPREPDVLNVPSGYANLLMGALIRFQNRLDCKPEDIRVRRFFLREPVRVRIKLFERWVPDFMCDPYHQPLFDPELNEDEIREVALGWMEDWLTWGKILLVLNHYETEIVQPHLKLTKAEAEKRIIGWPRLGASTSRLYTLSTYGTAFQTGVTPSGEQVLLGVYELSMVLVRFDASGELLGVERRPLSGMDTTSPVVSEQVKEQLAAWLAELSWVEQPIRVFKFLLSDCRVYISDFPNWAIVLYYDPDSCTDLEERRQSREQMASWEEAGKFVFWWGNDYHMNKDGEVIAT